MTTLTAAQLADPAKPRNIVEAILYWTINLTWLFYAIGALYIVGPVLGWPLMMLALLAMYLGQDFPKDLRAQPIPFGVLVWVFFMFLMLVVLWVGHVNYDKGLGPTIKSSVGWAKGWALFFVFQIIGAVIPIRREPLIRAQCIVGLQCLILLPIFVAAPMVGLPEKLFVSPLKAVGGPGPEYFSVYLYTIDPSNGASRWQFYAPWSPFAGLLGVIMVLMALEEKKPFWMICGVLAGLAMVMMTKSRMAMLGVIVCATIPRVMPLVFKSWAWGVAAAVTGSMAIIGGLVLQTISDAIYAFRAARADSTRVRDNLNNIAYERWGSEAPWFGHATVGAGAHVTEFMKIGTHHTWYGLLFVKGFFGLICLVIPVLYSLCEFLIMAAISPKGRLPLGLLLGMMFFSFGENLEVQAYLFWPATVILGLAARENLVDGITASVMNKRAADARRQPAKARALISVAGEPSPRKATQAKRTSVPKMPRRPAPAGLRPTRPRRRT
ncbi:MAG: O-antigen ligase domain-containing protein [Pseudomonadota bacterium]